MSKTNRNVKPKAKAKPVADKGKSKAASKTDAPLYLTEADVVELVTVKDAIATLEDLFATWGDASTVNLPRQRAQAGDGSFNLMGAAWGAKALFGLKAYYVSPGGARFHVLLYSAADSKLLAMIEADNLGRMRTGAASGLATKLLAKPDARTLGIVGTGTQALTQVAAICAVRPIEKVMVFSRGREHRESFVRAIEHSVHVTAKAMPSAEAAVIEADVVVTITKSEEPVLRANWLKSGVHINAAGANAATRREVDAETVLRSTVRATDQIAQAKEEAGEFRDLAATGRLQWSKIVELGDIFTGKALGRRGPADITLFKSLGIALEDIAFADLIVRRARTRGLGKQVASA